MSSNTTDDFLLSCCPRSSLARGSTTAVSLQSAALRREEWYRDIAPSWNKAQLPLSARDWCAPHWEVPVVKKAYNTFLPSLTFHGFALRVVRPTLHLFPFLVSDWSPQPGALFPRLMTQGT